MPKYIVEMPEGWDKKDCQTCPIETCEADMSICPFANAKPAWEVDVIGPPTLNGKPTKIFAVEVGE